MDDSDNDVGDNNISSGNKEEPVLALLSDSYSKLEIISVSISRPSSCPTLHFLLTILTTNYYLKRNINYFGLRRLFYSRQSLKNTYYSPMYTSHKRTNSTELIIEKSIEHIYKKWDIPVGFGTDKQLSFHYLASISLMLRIW